MEEKAARDKIADEISIVRGTFYGSAGIVARIVFLFIANLLLARYLGPDKYGAWSLCFLLITLGNALVIMGFDRSVSRFIGNFRGQAKDEEVLETVDAGIALSLGASVLPSL